MPDILIRGMEMPKTCTDCHDADLPTAIAWLGAKCPWANGIIDPGVHDLRHNRHPDCPLVELPPHGDLIDADALKAKAEYDRKHLEITGYERELLWHYLDVSMAPVIVPASK